MVIIDILIRYYFRKIWLKYFKSIHFEKYKLLNLGWSWENGLQEKEGLNNINNMRKPTSQLLKHKGYSWETGSSDPNGSSPLGILAKWVGSIMLTFIWVRFWLAQLNPIRVVSQNGLKWIEHYKLKKNNK